MLAMQAGDAPVIFDTNLEVATIRVAQTNDSGDQLFVAQALHIALEFNGERLT